MMSSRSRLTGNKGNWGGGIRGKLRIDEGFCPRATHKNNISSPREEKKRWGVVVVLTK
jgi:hypothetical protein